MKGLAALSMIAFCGIVHAGTFDNPQNLEVLPKDISPQALRQTMREFAFDLGMNSESCHVGEANQPLDKFDFALDDMALKSTARLMLRMVADINERLLAKLGSTRTDPMMIGDALRIAYREGGVPASVSRYRSLKAEYFGAYSYDFTERPRLEFSGSLAAQSDNAGAISFLLELHDEYGSTYRTDLQLGDLYLAAGDEEKAVGYFEAAQGAAPMAHRESIRIRAGGNKPGVIP